MAQREQFRPSLAVRALSLVLAAAFVAAACGDDSNVATDVVPYVPVEPELLFASGFSEGTSISPDLLDINGTDSETGFSWDDDRGWISSVGFYYAVKDPTEISQFMTTEIVEAEGPTGEPSRVLHLVNKGDDPNERSTSRNELSFFGREEGVTYEEGYIRYDTRLQPNLDQVVADGVEPRLYYFMESKDRAPGRTGGNKGHSGFRINIGITQDPATDQLYWVATGEQVQPVRQVEWQDRNLDVAVPLGEWFEVEAYIRRHPSDGRVYFAVNGETVFDLTVSTQNREEPRPLLFWSPFKLYHDSAWWAEGPTEQWYDNLEVWTGVPPHLDLGRRVQP
jgi:hypothetical protein